MIEQFVKLVVFVCVGIGRLAVASSRSAFLFVVQSTLLMVFQLLLFARKLLLLVFIKLVTNNVNDVALFLWMLVQDDDDDDRDDIGFSVPTATATTVPFSPPVPALFPIGIHDDHDDHRLAQRRPTHARRRS